MKKAKVSTQVHGVPQPRVTIRLKLGPRPPELEPYPCCICVSASRDDLLPVHDQPLAQHPAYAEIKAWMAHESCARVLPETWLDEVETGPILADGTRKREKVVFGADAIVKDRWNLVSNIRPRGLCSSLIMLVFKEMLILFQESPKDAWRANSMYQRKMPQGISRILCTRGSRTRNSLQGIG